MGRSMQERRIHPKTCEFCNNLFMAVYRKNRYCSRKCASRHRKSDSTNSITFDLLVKANNNPNIDQKIAYVMKKTGLGHSTINYRMRDLGYRWTRDYCSRAATKQVRSHISAQSCVLCEETRVIELAHIVPDCEGGTATYDNLLPLCPTHHRLWDKGALDQSESEDLEYIFSKKFGSLKSIKEMGLLE